MKSKKLFNKLNKFANKYIPKDDYADKVERWENTSKITFDSLIEDAAIIAERLIKNPNTEDKEFLKALLKAATYYHCHDGTDESLQFDHKMQKIINLL